MNPAQTLADLYNQIALIREFICQDSIFQKDIIDNLPRIENGVLEEGLTLSYDSQIAFTYNLALSKLLNESSGWSSYKKRQIDNYSSFLFGLLSEWKNREINSFHLITALNSILMELVRQEKELRDRGSIVSIFAEQYGNREIQLNGGKLAVIEVLDYPPHIGKEFYFGGTLPDSRHRTITEGVILAIYSDILDCYLLYRQKILAPSLAVPLVPEASRLLLSVYDNISTKVTIYE